MSDEVEVLDKDLVVVRQGILKAAEITLAGITQLVNSAALLEIKGLDDKAGYDAVHNKRMEFVHTRGKLVKAAKKGREAAIKYQGDNIKVEKSLVGLMKPTEDELAAKEKVIDDAKDAIKKEKERLEAERIQKRIDRLEQEFGMGLFGQNYKLPFDAPGTELPLVLVRSCTDEQYEKFCAAIQEAKDKETVRLVTIAAEKKAEEERLAKIAAEQEAERLRLEAAKKDQEEKAAKLKAEQDALEAEKKRIADAEAARLRAIEDEKLRVENEKNRQAELEQARKEAAEKALKDAEEKAKQEAQKKADREEKERIAAAKKEARRPDKEKLLALAKAIEDSTVLPQMKTEEGNKIMMDFHVSLFTVTGNLKSAAEVL